MNLRLLLSICICFFIGSTAYGQVPPPCPTQFYPGAPACPQACVYCDFDGYMGNNSGTASGGNIVCNQITLHNDQWFAFVAGTTSITIDILTSNCSNGDGLQAAFFDDCDEDAIACNVGVGGGAGIPLTLSYSGFVPGQTYWLMIDGYIADVCDYEIDVTDGSVTPPPPSAPAVPMGPTMVCPGATVEYSIPAADGAGYYRWITPPGSQINGGGNNVQFPAPEGTTVTVTFGNAGGTVCVQVGNACYAPLQACLPVINQPIPVTVLQPVVVCFEDAPYYWQEEPYTVLNAPGNYTLTSTPYISYLGCDSTVRQTITIKNQITKNIGVQYICEGGCFTINNVNYCQTGSFSEKFESFQGCDSIVQFTILKVPNSAVIDSVTQIISCNNPTVTLNSSSTGPGITFSWSNAMWNVLGTQSAQAVNAGGVYNLVVSNTIGSVTCRDTATVTVQQNINLPNISVQGGTMTCQPGGSSVVLMGNSTTPGVNFLWTGPGITPANQNQKNPTVAVAGTYVLMVTNPANNCVAKDSAIVIANNVPPTATIVSDTISCTLPNVVLNSTTNAPNPTYLWTGPGINPGNQNVADPTVSQAGTYTVTITNPANACTNTASITIIANTAVPTASAGNDLTINCVQSTVDLQGSGTPANSNFLWTGPGISPANQNLPMPTVNQAGTYILTVTNPANGCSQKDTTLVQAALTPPTVDAGADKTINCLITSVVLGGNGSSQGPGFQATWTGPGINPGNQNQFTPSVNQPGLYTLTITNSINGCTATDNVTIDINTNIPTAEAGPDQALTCLNPNGVSLEGNGTPAGVTFLWSGPGIDVSNETMQNPLVSQAGTYTILVTNPVNGCTETDSVVVIQDANVPVANAGLNLNLNCNVTTVDINGSGSTTGPNIVYQWTGPGITPANANVQSPSGITLAGTYSLLVTDTSNSCKNTDMLLITIDTVAPTANAGTDLTLNCYNSATDTLDASASSTGANFTVLWSGPGINAGNQNSPLAPVTVPGTYNLLLTNTTTGCTATDQAQVLPDLNPPAADAGIDHIIDCVVTSTSIGGNSSSGPNITYSWSGSGINAGNQSQAQATVSQAGLYTLQVTNSVNGCTATDDVLVTLNATYPTTLAGPDFLLTCTQPTQALDGSASSNGPNFQIVWSGPDINAGNQNNLTPTIGLPGTYILVITDQSNSCVTQDTVVITENKVIPAAAAGLNQGLDCQVISVTLDGSSSSAGVPIVYLWTGAGINAGNQNDQSPIVDQPGVYNLVVTDTDNGCTATSSVTITQDIVAPVASAGASITLTCQQNTQAIDGSGSSVGAEFEYLWQGPGINTSNFDVQNPMVSDSGIYSLLVTNIQNHCTATAAVFVDMDQDLPTTNAGPNQTLTCQNDTLVLDGSSSQSGAGITYNWTGPGIVTGTQTSTTPQIYLPGSYTLTVFNANNGCSATDIAVIDQDIVAPIANAGTDQVLTCTSAAGVTISAAASDTGPGYSLLWSGPGINAANQNQLEPLVTVSGTYTVLITNTVNGCTKMDETIVSVDQNQPLANAGLDQTISCSIVQVTLNASGSTASGPLEYLWSGPGITAGNQDLINPIVDQSGMYTVVVTNTVNGCTASDNVDVLLNTNPPLASATGGQITCTNPEITISSMSSVVGSTFEWSGPDIDLANMSLQNPMVGAPGAYIVIVTAPNGCTATASATVDIDANVPVGTATGTELNCLNNGQNNITGTVTTPGVTFAWTGPNGFTSNILNPVVNTAGTYTLTLSSANGCSKAYQATVTANFVKPTAVATVNDKLDCTTTTVSLSGNGSSNGVNFTYNWTTVSGNILSGATTLTPAVDAAGPYILQVTNSQNGCTNTSSVTVEYDPAVPSAFDLTVQNIRCYGEVNGFIAINSIVGGTQPFLYSFNGGPATGTGQYSQLGAGNYTLSLLDANGCTLDTIVNISAPGALQVDLGADLFLKLDTMPITITATIIGTTPIQTIVWNPPAPCAAPCLTYDTVATHSYLQTITVRDSNGCISTDRQLIQVDRSRRIYIPNVFNTLSNDPLNSILMVQGGSDILRIKTWQIFDRWGNAIFSRNDFQPNDPTDAWDGKARGDEAASAVYTWFIEVEFIDGEVEQFKGDVTLLRN